MRWALARRAATAAVLGLVTAAADVRADTESLEQRVDTLLAAANAAETADRDRALRGFRELGTPALPVLLARLGPKVDTLQWETTLAALAAIDVEQALAAVECHRSRWPAWKFAQTVPGRDGARVADVVIARLSALRDPRQTVRVPLAAATLDDAFRIPPWTERALADKVPAQLAGADLPLRERAPGRLELDADADGQFDRTLELDEQVVRAGPSQRPLLVYRKLGKWYAAPASALRGVLRGKPVEFLDGDQDGDFNDACDLVRFGDGAFRGIRESSLAWLGSETVRFALKQEDGKWTLHVATEPEPEWMKRPQAAPMAELQKWRHAAGLVVERIDFDRVAACEAHRAYWTRHGYSGHDQIEGFSGYTKEGAEAGASSIVGPTGDAVELVRWSVSTLLHRQAIVAGPKEGAGVAGLKGGSIFWGGIADASVRGFPVLYPGAGQTDVPPEIERERPDPERMPRMYAQPHGFPVSLTWAGVDARYRDLKDPKIELFTDASSEPLPAMAFSPAEPVHSKFLGAYGSTTVACVAIQPLAARTVYTARFSGTGPRGAVEHVWRFRTR